MVAVKAARANRLTLAVIHARVLVPRHDLTIPFTDGARRSYHQTARQCGRRFHY